MSEKFIAYSPHFQSLAGVSDKNLRRIEKRFDVKVFVRDEKIWARGEDDGVSNAISLISQLIGLYDKGFDLNNGAVKFIIPAFYDDPSIRIEEVFSEKIHLATGRGDIMPRSVAQKEYVFAMGHFDVVLAIGPAGTGKTYLAMAAAVSDLLRKRVSRIILTRPAVEAGEKLGYLPGDLYEKINPYLRPLHDALYDMLDADLVNKMIEDGMIEIAPLAYMRGRTLNDAFIVLDEAQNATAVQMKMFLTRLGMNSKMVITGDVTQIDLPTSTRSGLVNAKEVLRDVPGIRFVNFTEKDVVRHDLVRKILKAYEKAADHDRGNLANGTEENK